MNNVSPAFVSREGSGDAGRGLALANVPPRDRRAHVVRRGFIKVNLDM
jgi:hypothetical protein